MPDGASIGDQSQSASGKLGKWRFYTCIDDECVSDQRHIRLPGTRGVDLSHQVMLLHISCSVLHSDSEISDCMRIPKNESTWYILCAYEKGCPQLKTTLTRADLDSAGHCCLQSDDPILLILAFHEAEMVYPKLSHEASIHPLNQSHHRDLIRIESKQMPRTEIHTRYTICKFNQCIDPVEDLKLAISLPIPHMGQNGPCRISLQNRTT